MYYLKHKDREEYIGNTVNSRVSYGYRIVSSMAQATRYEDLTEAHYHRHRLRRMNPVNEAFEVIPDPLYPATEA